MKVFTKRLQFSLNRSAVSCIYKVKPLNEAKERRDDMTLDRLIKAVMKYMDERGMLEDMKKKYRDPPGKKPRSRPPSQGNRGQHNS